METIMQYIRTHVFYELMYRNILNTQELTKRQIVEFTEKREQARELKLMHVKMYKKLDN